MYGTQLAIVCTTYANKQYDFYILIFMWQVLGIWKSVVFTGVKRKNKPIWCQKKNLEI